MVPTKTELQPGTYGTYQFGQIGRCQVTADFSGGQSTSVVVTSLPAPDGHPRANFTLTYWSCASDQNFLMAKSVFHPQPTVY